MKKKNGPLFKMTRDGNGQMLGRENVMASLDLKPFLMQFSIWILVNVKKKDIWKLFSWVHIPVSADYSCHIIYKEKLLR